MLSSTHWSSDPVILATISSINLSSALNSIMVQPSTDQYSEQMPANHHWCSQFYSNRSLRKPASSAFSFVAIFSLTDSSMISSYWTIISAIRIVTSQWRFTQKTFSFDMQTIQHHSQIPKVYPHSTHLQFSLFIFQNFSNATLIFTDGSKSPSGVDAAFWIPATSFSRLLSLPFFSSIFHAVQAAIFKVIDYIIQNFASGSLLMIADSLSALQSLSS